MSLDAAYGPEKLAVRAAAPVRERDDARIADRSDDSFKSYLDEANRADEPAPAQPHAAEKTSEKTPAASPAENAGSADSKDAPVEAACKPAGENVESPGQARPAQIASVMLQMGAAATDAAASAAPDVAASTSSATPTSQTANSAGNIAVSTPVDPLGQTASASTPVYSGVTKTPATNPADAPTAGAAPPDIANIGDSDSQALIAAKNAGAPAPACQTTPNPAKANKGALANTGSTEFNADCSKAGGAPDAVQPQIAQLVAAAPAEPAKLTPPAGLSPMANAQDLLQGQQAAGGATTPNIEGTSPEAGGAKAGAASAQAGATKTLDAAAVAAPQAPAASSDAGAFASLLPQTITASASTAATPAPAAQTALPAALQQAPDAAIQVYSRIVERFDGQAQRFEVRLDPAELGRVEVRIEIGADKRVHAVLAAHDGAALSDLMRGRHQLEQALTSAGLELSDDGLKFELARDDGRGFQHRADTDGEARRGPNRSERAYLAPVDADTLAVLRPASWRSSRVNLVA